MSFSCSQLLHSQFGNASPSAPANGTASGSHTSLFTGSNVEMRFRLVSWLGIHTWSTSFAAKAGVVQESTMPSGWNASAIFVRTSTGANGGRSAVWNESRIQLVVGWSGATAAGVSPGFAAVYPSESACHCAPSAGSHPLSPANGAAVASVSHGWGALAQSIVEARGSRSHATVGIGLPPASSSPVMPVPRESTTSSSE